MENSENLKLPYILPSQAQKHVTHNEALAILDAVVQLAVASRSLVVPPAAAADGERHIVGSPAAGDWLGHEHQIAVWRDGGWQFLAPNTGWIAWVADEMSTVCWTGVAWAAFTETVSALQNLAFIGLATTADAGNPFAARLNTALWTARTVADGGDGDLRYTLNKEGGANTLSMLFQSDWSGRAELGLVGDDDFAIKVSPDGSDWRTAMAFDRVSGGVRFLASEVTVASAGVCDLGEAPALKVFVTGSETITSFGTAVNALRFIRFAGAPVLVHDSAGLALPGAQDLECRPGDSAIALSDASGNWTVAAYQRADGKALTPPSAAEIADGPVGGRRNAFINPFFDIAQAYEGPFTATTGHTPVDMLRFSAASGGGAWQGELVDFTPGQAAVPANPRRFLRLTQQEAPASGYAALLFVSGPVTTLAGRAVAASLYARVASGTLDVALSFMQHFGAGGSTTVFSAGGSTGVTLTTEWRRITHGTVLPGVSGKTIEAGNYLALRLISNGSGASLYGDFCGVQIELGTDPTELNPVPAIEAEMLCRHYYEKVQVHAINGAIWIPALPKRAVPAVTASAGSVSGPTRNGCLLAHDADAPSTLTFDARL